MIHRARGSRQVRVSPLKELSEENAKKGHREPAPQDKEDAASVGSLVTCIFLETCGRQYRLERMTQLAHRVALVIGFYFP